MENVFGHLEQFAAIWYILWTIGKLVVILYIFPRFGILSKKIWQPWCLCLLGEGKTVP
jgi:hypothetical protein